MPPAKMQKWEYMMVYATNMNFLKMSNDMGVVGWEMVNIEGGVPDAMDNHL